MSKSLISLIFIALVSAMAVVNVRHESRQAYQSLHGLDMKRDELNIEYGQLMLERATWSVRESVEQEASEELGMYIPEPANIITLSIGESQSQ
ncbi:MAG: cell division protein FtsL [Parasphingorhabdus sp.]|jgi:cell division protein FtsL